MEREVMEAIYHAFQHWMLCACLAGLGLIAALVFLAKVAAPAWDALRRWWSLPCIQRVIVAVCVVGLSYYGATKQGWHVGYDGGIKAGATANVVTNDTVSIHWQRDTSGGVYVPESAAVYIDYRPNTETNAEWGLLAQTTVGAWGWSGTVENATNYDYNVWAYYIPPEPVHTNGVWTYKTHFDRRGEYALPLRARVEVNGVAIATPAEKRKDAEKGADAKSYIQDGLVAMWDGIENAGWGVHDPNATTWVDLIGGNNLPCSAGSVSDSWIRYSSSYQKNIPEPIITGYEFTIQGVYDRSETTGNFCAIGFGYSTSRLCVGNASSFGCRFGSTYNTKNVVGPRNAITWLRSNADVTCVRLFDGETDKGIFPQSQAGSLTESNRLCINGENPYGNYRNRFSVANIRIYNRALTAEEIAHNNKIDKRRFNLP